MISPFEGIRLLKNGKRIQKKSYNSFINTRILASSDSTLGLGIFFNEHYNIPESTQIDLLSRILPMFTNERYNYFKSKKESKEVQGISKYYNISPKEALEYMEFMDKSEIKKIVKIIENSP